tara:strand:- start:711 stop:2615 length:1905 start_codon:yes stop_codon:yes gene_type:complete
MAKSPKAAKLKKDIDEFNTDKLNYVRIWDLCLLFLQGRQQIVYDRTTGDLRRSRVEGSSVTINLILNMYRNLQSRLEVNYPGTTVLPASPSAEDVVKAKSSEAALQYYWQAQRMSGHYSNLVGWILSCGNAAFHTRYNGEDVTTEVVSPYNLYFEPGVTCDRESNWTAMSKLVNREDLEKAYPEHAEIIRKAASVPRGKDQKKTFYGLYPSQDLQDRLEIFEVYFKNGDRKVLLDENYLFEGKWIGKEIPVQIVRYCKIPGRLWGMGAVEPLLEIQISYNKVRSQIIENAELIGNPKWLIPKTAGVGPNSITSRKGEKIYYNPAGGAPTAVTPPSLPGFVLQNASQLASEMMDVSGLHATSLGKRAVGVTSGKAIEALSGRDMTQLQTTQNDLERASEKLGKVVLTLMRKYYTEGKMMRMMDSLGRVVFNYLKTTDFVDDPEIFIEAGSLFRNEKQDRDQKVIDMLQLGLIEKDAALRELKFGTGNTYVSERLQSMAHANDILMAAASGKPVEIFPTDDLEVFKEVFGDYIKSADYYELPYDRQSYIRDVFISLVTFGAPDQVAAEAHFKRTVFPRPTPSSDSEQAFETAYQSPVSALQQEAEFDRMSSLKMAQQMVDEVPEQGLRRTGMGGGG